MRKVLLIFYFVPLLFFGQSWKTKKGDNKFDGAYKAAYVIGSGGHYPYTSPRLTVNRFSDSDYLNIYLSNIGYTGCSDNNVQIIFDNEETQYQSKNVSTNSDRDALFIGSFYELSLVDFIDKLKKHSTLYLRFTSSCGQDDFKFRLSGSSNAIDFVAKDLLVRLREEEIIQKEKERIEKEQKNIILNFFKENPSPHLTDSVSINKPIITLDVIEDKAIDFYKSIFDNNPEKIELNKGDAVTILNYHKMKFVNVQLPNGERWLASTDIFSILNHGFQLLYQMKKQKYPLLIPPLDNYKMAKFVTKTSILKSEPYSAAEEININKEKGTPVKVYPYQYDQYILIEVNGIRGFIRNTKYNLKYD